MMKTTTLGSHPLALIARSRTLRAAENYAMLAGLTNAQAREYLRQARGKRAARALAADEPPDTPVSIRWRHAKAVAAIRAADYRRAMNGHHEVIWFGGFPSAASDAESMWANQCPGIRHPKAYIGYRVVESWHTFTFAPNWLSRVCVRGAAVVDGLLTLDMAGHPSHVDGANRAYPATWVRQGRGTSLVTVRGWVVTTARGCWSHALTARTAARMVNS